MNLISITGSGSNWDDKNAAMSGNAGGNVSGAWDAQTPGVWQQQQKNKQLMGLSSGAGEHFKNKTKRFCKYKAIDSIQLDDLNDWNHGIQTPKQQQNKMAGKCHDFLSDHTYLLNTTPFLRFVYSIYSSFI